MDSLYRQKYLFIIAALTTTLLSGCKSSELGVLSSLTFDGREGTQLLPQDRAVLNKIQELNFVSWEIGEAEQELVAQCPNLRFLSLQSTRFTGISTFHVPASVLSFRFHAPRDSDTTAQLTGGSSIASCCFYRIDNVNLEFTEFADSKKLTELWICDSQISPGLAQWLWSQDSLVSLYFRGNAYPVGFFSHWDLHSLVTADFRATSMTPEIKSFLRCQDRLQSARGSKQTDD